MLNLDFRNRSQIETEIVGALKQAIDAHGPITLENRCSAAKRVYMSLKELAKRNRPEKKRRGEIGGADNKSLDLTGWNGSAQDR